MTIVDSEFFFERIKKKPILERFWEKVIIKRKDDCWIWNSAVSNGKPKF